MGLFSKKRPGSGSSAGPENSSKPTITAEQQKVIMQKRIQIKQAQEEALERLPLRKLYIVLWIRNDPPEQNDFHWGFYYHKTAAGGAKYHIKELSSGWITDHGTTGGVMKSLFLCVLIEIGTISESSEATFDQIVRTYDRTLNTIQGLTCRVWVMKIIPLLVRQGLLRCNDVKALQAECMNFGNRYARSAAAAEQPRPIMVATTCF
ncbi:hypothetical protein UCRPC4_g01197 [Phaeomoniella chlamydospora]|uniref:Uncharacterized protein n=1 Tax=Phaeomoniella chlamydospora TaxID=158046 RepID=A0A0G2EYI5_PHACM|nr:hypothetical protein UCRPC4_g01197 [Phaeomoniella chlamydospora]